MRGLICLAPSNDVFQLEHKENLFGFRRIKLRNYFVQNTTFNLIYRCITRRVFSFKKTSLLGSKKARYTAFLV
jgi:hypothetical protein